MAQKKILLFYFSGTGNTWWLVNQFRLLAENDSHLVKMISIEKINDSDWPLILEDWKNSDLIGFAHPIYGSTAPKFVKNFIKTIPEKINLDDIEKKNGFIFTTMELFSGDGGFALIKLVKILKIDIQYVFNFQMLSNLGIPLITYNPVKQKRFEKRKKRTLEKLARVYHGLMKERRFFQNKFNPLGYLFGWIQRVSMKSLENKNWKYLGVDEEKCISCMKCVNQCPTHAIKVVEGKFIFTESCTACYRCYNFCPTQAITVFGRTANPKRQRQHKLFMNEIFYKSEKL